MKSSRIFLFGIALIVATASPAQFLKKLQQKAEQKLEKKVDKEVDKELGINQNQPTQTQPGGQNNPGGSSSGNSGGNNPSNNSGGGLISTPPNVKQNLSDAEASYKKNNYSEARYAVQQAMLGVELEIGNQILKSLPETISSLLKDVSSDQVTSTGSGWAGLTIQRKYQDKKDKQLTIIIANNAMWMSAVNAYMTNGGYAQQTGGEQNWKQTKVKGNRAIIEFDKSSGYKLSVPIGQSSLIVYEGINFASEQDMIKAAETVDIDGVKKMLGEQ